MLLNGFDALFPNNNPMNFDFTSYEDEKSIIIPESYKEFLRRYKTGYNSLRHEYYFDQQMGMKIPLVSYYYEKDNIGFSLNDFFSIDDIPQVQGSTEMELGLLRIIPTFNGGGGGFCIGVKKDINLGKIYFFSWDDNEPIYLEDDIFKFIAKIKSVFNINVNPYLKDKHIFKNWGEDFWRVRENESK